MNEIDRQFMYYALFLAKKGRFTTSPNPNVGCIIVKNKQIIGEGFHYSLGGDHAEIFALKMAGKNSKNSTVYVTLEPCSYYSKTPPCVKALIEAGVKKVIIAMEDPNPKVSGRGILKLRQAGISVSVGLLKHEAKKLNLAFIKRMTTGLPYIQVKIAISLDGKTSLSSGESKWITSIAARQDAQKFRAQVSAILTTSKTILSDNPRLNVRWSDFSSDIKSIYPESHVRQPIRIIIDANNEVNPKHLITKIQGECWLIRKNVKLQSWRGCVKQIIIPTNTKKFCLTMIMMQLANRNINSILIEAGPNFAGRLLTLGLIDELIIYLAPRILGFTANGIFNIPEIEKLKYSPTFKFIESKFIGGDLRLILQTINSN